MKLLEIFESLVYSRHITDSPLSTVVLRRGYADKKRLGRDPSGRPIKQSLRWAGSMVSSTDSGSALPNTGPDGKKQGTAYELILSVIPFMTLCKLQLSASKSSWMVHSCNHLTYFIKMKGVGSCIKKITQHIQSDQQMWTIAIILSKGRSLFPSLSGIQQNAIVTSNSMSPRKEL